MLAHLVSLENEDPLAVYETVRKELATFDKDLASKHEIIILTKTDMVTPLRAKEVEKAMKKTYPRSAVFTITILDDAGMKTFQDNLLKLLKKEA